MIWRILKISTRSLRAVEARGASRTYSSIVCRNDAGGFIIHRHNNNMRHILTANRSDAVGKIAFRGQTCSILINRSPRPTSRFLHIS